MENRGNDEISFHMEQYTDDVHSLTQEELIEDLKQKKQQALDSIREYRKEYITNLLTQNNINPESIDIEKILDGEVPEWLLELQKKNSQRR